MAVLTLVERGGATRSFHVLNVTAKTLRPLVLGNARPKAQLMTDEAPVYGYIGRKLVGHSTVNHRADEYARLGRFVRSSTTADTGERVK